VSTISTKTDSDNAQQTVETHIEPSKPEDAADIVSAFNDEYAKYYGKYVDEKALHGFLETMREDMEEDSRPEEVVRTVKNIEGNFVGVGALKFDDNLVELGSTIIEPDFRKRENQNGQGIYDELFVDRHEDAAAMVRDEDDPIDLAYTQLLADRSAATQYTAHKHDYAVTGVYDKKFPVAYEGKGRVTVVDMLWADSNIENSQEEVYVPDEAEKLVDAALDNIEGKRSEDLPEITRELQEGDVSRREQSYRVESKAVDKPDEDPMNFAEVEVVADGSGEYSWEEVLEEIDSAQDQIENPEEDYWVGVSMDVNSPTGADAAEALQDLGFEYAGFNPGKLEAGEENRDSLELQYRPSQETYVKEFVDEAVKFMEKSGMEFEEAEEGTGYGTSEALRV
jgi:hypothetical protein